MSMRIRPDEHAHHSMGVGLQALASVGLHPVELARKLSAVNCRHSEGVRGIEAADHGLLEFPQISKNVFAGPSAKVSRE